jgi:hypothetical protein
VCTSVDMYRMSFVLLLLCVPRRYTAARAFWSATPSGRPVTAGPVAGGPSAGGKESAATAAATAAGAAASGGSSDGSSFWRAGTSAGAAGYVPTSAWTGGCLPPVLCACTFPVHTFPLHTCRIQRPRPHTTLPSSCVSGTFESSLFPLSWLRIPFHSWMCGL